MYTVAAAVQYCKYSSCFRGVGYIELQTGQVYLIL